MSMVDPNTKKIPLFHKFKVGFGVIVNIFLM